MLDVLGFLWGSIHHGGAEFTESGVVFIKNFFLRVLGVSAV
jgi:hypothetical protein